MTNMRIFFTDQQRQEFYRQRAHEAYLRRKARKVREAEESKQEHEDT